MVTCQYIGPCPAGLISGYTLIFIFCCFVITVHWSLLKQQDLDTVRIIQVSYSGRRSLFGPCPSGLSLSFWVYFGLACWAVKVRGHFPRTLSTDVHRLLASLIVERFADLTIRVIQFFGTDAKVTLVHRLLKLRSCNMSRLFWAGKVFLSGGRPLSSKSSGLLLSF